MLKVKILVVALLFVTLLCSCQQTPEEVKNNMGEYGVNKQVDTSDITYCSVDKLREIKDYEISGNIEFDGEIDFSGVEGVDILNLSIEKEFLTDNNKEKYTELFGADKDKYEESEAGESDWGNDISYENEEKRNYLVMLENGGMASMSRGAYDSGESIIEEKYDIDKDDVSGVDVKLEEGEVNIAQACVGLEKWLGENMPIEGIEYRISDVYVRKMKNDEQSKRLAMCAEYVHKGIRLNNHTAPIIEESDDYTLKQYTTDISTKLEYDGLEVPCYFSRNYHLKIESTEPVEKLVDFDSAVNILKETMSGFGVFHISKIYPLYLLKLTDNSEGPGARIEARPSYAFLVTDKGEDSWIGVIKSNSCRHYFFIDMVTGEIVSDLITERK